jgi:hypothetical protein
LGRNLIIAGHGVNAFFMLRLRCAIVSRRSRMRARRLSSRNWSG